MSQTCKKCGSPLTGIQDLGIPENSRPTGFCSDQTCPYSDRRQDGYGEFRKPINWLDLEATPFNLYDLAELFASANDVVNAWGQGNLAEAVNRLREALEELNAREEDEDEDEDDEEDDEDPE